MFLLEMESGAFVDSSVKSYFAHLASDHARWAAVIEIAAREKNWADLWYVLQNMREVALKGGNCLDAGHIKYEARDWFQEQGFVLKVTSNGSLLLFF